MHRSTHKILTIAIALLLAFLATEALAGGQGHGHGHANYYGHGHGYGGGHGYGYGYGHGHGYNGYPGRGYSSYYLPSGYHSAWYGGSPYYYHGGAWYRPYGSRYVVVAPPIGIGIGLSVLPPYFRTYWYAGSPYYYYGNTYYRYMPSRREYVVTEAPQGAPRTEATGDAGELYAYPRNGQDEQRQSLDRDECQQWAVSKTGFDPSRTDVNTTKRADFHRAEGACLEARGYSVK